MTAEPARPSPLIPASAAACLTVSLGIGLFVQDASNPLMMLPFVLCSLWLATSGRLLSLNLRDPALLGLLGLWTLWALSSLHSAFPFNSQVTWLIMSTLPVSFMVWRSAGFDAVWITRLQGLALLSGAGLAVYALLQVTLLKANLWNGRAGLPFADPNMLGIYFSLLLLPLGAALLAQKFNPLLRGTLVIVLVLLLAGLCATQSRSALIGTIAGAGLLAVLLRRQVIWSLPVKIATGAGLTLFVATLFASDFISRFISIFSEHGDRDFLSRFSIWQSAWLMSTEHPWLGYGFGTFGLFYPVFRQPIDNSGGWWVHMDPLQWAVESGWVTPVVFYSLCVFLALRVYRLARSGTLTTLQAGCAAALLSLFLNAHTSYPLHVIPFMLIAGSMICALTPDPLAGARAKTFVFASTILVTLLLSQLTVLRVGSTLYYWQEITQARAKGDTARFSAATKNCIEHGDPHYAFCKFIVIETALNTTGALPDMTLQLIDNARLYNTQLPQPDFYLGLYYLRTAPGQPEKAIAAFRESLIKDPTFWTARRVLVATLVAAGKKEDALAALRKGADYPATQADRSFYDTMYKHLTEPQPDPQPNSSPAP